MLFFCMRYVLCSALLKYWLSFLYPCYLRESCYCTSPMIVLCIYLARFIQSRSNGSSGLAWTLVSTTFGQDVYAEWFA